MLISLEGIDGSGKSTQARLLSERLSSSGLSTVLLREPGGTDLSERIRNLLLNGQVAVEPFAELLLFSAARNQLVHERVLPALAAGVVVVCDRFFDSTTAYQGGGRGLFDVAWLRDFNVRVTEGLVPDRTYFIAVDPQDALRRRDARQREAAADASSEASGAGPDRIEAAGLTFQQKVAQTYERVAREEPHRVVRLDGHLTIRQIHDIIWTDVLHLLGSPAET